MRCSGSWPTSRPCSTWSAGGPTRWTSPTGASRRRDRPAWRPSTATSWPATSAETLILLGRWPEARSLCLRALRWAPVGVGFLDAWIFLAAVEIETEAGEAAARLLGQTVLEFDALREPQLAGSYYLVAASYSLWRGDVSDASRSVERGWAVVKSTEEWVLAARMAAMVAQVDAAAGAEARERRQLAPLAAARARTAEVVATAAALVRAGAAPPVGRVAPDRRGVPGDRARLPAAARG